MADPKHPPMLTRANVSFHTNDEDKDHDTRLDIYVLLEDQRTQVARLTQCFGHFADNTDAGPYNLVLLQSVSRETLRLGSVYIELNPNGNDTWRFNFLLDLVFSDGGHLFSKSNGIELGQFTRQLFVGIE